MKIITPSFEIINMEEGQAIIKRLEIAARTCYKSEEKMTPTSAAELIDRIITSGHHSVLEHASATVRIICDRGISHELVRHRVASFSQESTRYANYSKEKFGNEITLIKPFFWNTNQEEYKIWIETMQHIEKAYLALLALGSKPQEARSVLPNSLKTEIVTTCNFREWRHIFILRCVPAAHPQIREIMLPLLDEMHSRVPELFADLYSKFEKDISKFKTQDLR